MVRASGKNLMTPNPSKSNLNPAQFSRVTILTNQQNLAIDLFLNVRQFVRSSMKILGFK